MLLHVHAFLKFTATLVRGLRQRQRRLSEPLDLEIRGNKLRG